MAKTRITNYLVILLTIFEHLLIHCNSKALLYPQVHEGGVQLSVKSGKALCLNKKGAGAAICTDTFPFCTEPYPVGDSRNTQSEGPLCEGRLPHSDASFCGLH